MTELEERFLARGKAEKTLGPLADEHTGEWVYGCFLPFDNQAVITRLMCGEPTQEYIVRTETLGRYTGLKDKNGTRIFEGDIITSPCGLDVVEFYEGCFCVRGNAQDILCDVIGTYENEVAIVGNIHDNPELLGE